MKNHPLVRHLAVAFLIVTISYTLFTLLPGTLPHPEDFSPFAYAAALVACVEIWLLVGERRRKWAYLPILLLCTLALLDEIGYGSEVLGLQPFYSQTLHIEIRDLHNVIGLAFELGSRWLSDHHWNGALFVQFLGVDAALLASGLAFGWLLRRGMAEKKEATRQGRILWLVAGFILLAGAGASGYLLSLPQDPKNALLLGYSATRLLSAVGVLAISLLPMGYLLTLRSQKTKETWAKLDGLMKATGSRAILAGAGLVVLAGLVYQFYAPLAFLPDDQTRLVRFTPLALWLLAAAWFVFLGAWAWRGGLRRSWVDFFKGTGAFLVREPAYFYAGFALVLILIAQLIDRNVIPLNEMIQTPNFWVKLWGLWTEETFEMNGAFLFIAAAAHFRLRGR